MAATVDLDAYFRRVNWSGSRDPTLETLAGLIEAHTRISRLRTWTYCSA